MYAKKIAIIERSTDVMQFCFWNASSSFILEPKLLSIVPADLLVLKLISS